MDKREAEPVSETTHIRENERGDKPTPPAPMSRYLEDNNCGEHGKIDAMKLKW